MLRVAPVAEPEAQIGARSSAVVAVRVVPRPRRRTLLVGVVGAELGSPPAGLPVAALTETAGAAAGVTAALTATGRAAGAARREQHRPRSTAPTTRNGQPIPA